MTTPFISLLRARMAERDLSADALARELGATGGPISGQAIRYWLHGVSRPTPERLGALAAVLGCTHADLALAVAGLEPSSDAAGVSAADVGSLRG